MTSSILNLLWLQAWQIAVLFALIGLVCVCLRRASAHWRYLLWLVVLIKCLAPPIMPVVLPGVAGTIQHFFTRQSPTNQDSRQAAEAGSLPTRSFQDSRPQAAAGLETLSLSLPLWKRIDWQFCFGMSWAIGCLGYLMTALVKAWRIQCGLKRTRTWPDMELECEFLGMAKMIGIRHRPKLCLIRGLGQPFVWGIFRGSIYLPENFGRQGTSRERRLVMGHELAHVLRWDALINFIQVIVQAVFFFHPIVWWLNRIIRHEREKCCDEMAIASLKVDSREYGTAIVDRLAAYYEPACPASSLAISGHAKDLEDRVRSLLLPGRSFRRRPTVTAVATAALVVATVGPIHLVLTAEPTQTPVAAAPKTVSWTQVDLSTYANAKLMESWLPGAIDNDLSALTAGRQVLSGVPFEIDGVLQLSGKDMPQSARSFPARIEGIKIGRSFARLNLLHGCAGTDERGVQVAKIVLHYKDGQSEALSIDYGVRVRDWSFWEFDPVGDPDTTMAWTGSNLNSRSQNGALRLYRTTWINPRPLSEVVCIDYVSDQSKAAPFLVALTVN
jgi:beta-lactamase regulating signal transducer with metallopeptidase domain